MRMHKSEGCVRDTQGLVACDRSAAEPGVARRPQAGTPCHANRKIDAGKKQWDDKIKTFLTAKQEWQDEIKSAAMEKSLERMIGATGSALNDRLKVLAANANIQADIPEVNVTDLVASAMQDFDRNKPSNERIFGEINKSISAFNTTLELGNATHFKGFNSTTLEGDFASNMETFSKKMAILNNVKLYENFKKMMSSFKENLRENDVKISKGLEASAISSGYELKGGTFFKDAGLWGDYDFVAYRNADIDGMMNRAIHESGMAQLSSEEMVAFLEKGRDVDVKLFFEVQTMALENAFKLVAGDKSNKGYYGDYVGKMPEYNNDGDETNQGSGELGGWENGQMWNKLTYRGLNKEEKALAEKRKITYTAMGVTAAIAGITGGGFSALAMSFANSIISTGAAISGGKDVGGALAMGGFNFGTGLAGSMMGSSTLASLGRGALNMVKGGVGQNADGTLNFDFAGNLGKGGAASIALSTGASILGNKFGDMFTNKDLGFAFSSTIDAIGDGVKFDSGGASGFSFANFAGSLAGNYAGRMVNNLNSTSTDDAFYKGSPERQIMASQIGKLATSLTTSLVGSAMNDRQAANNLSVTYTTPSNGWSDLGGITGRLMGARMQEIQQQRAASGQSSGVPVGTNAVEAMMAQGAIGRRRDDFLDSLVDLGDSWAGQAAGKLNAKLDGAFDAAVGWTKDNLLSPLGNALGNATSAVENFFTDHGYANNLHRYSYANSPTLLADNVGMFEDGSSTMGDARRLAKEKMEMLQQLRKEGVIDENGKFVDTRSGLEKIGSFFASIGRGIADIAGTVFDNVLAPVGRAVRSAQQYVMGFSEGGYWERAKNSSMYGLRVANADLDAELEALGEKWDGRTCFIAGTLIHTKLGARKIEEIKVHDEVMSWDEKSGAFEYQKVTELFIHDTNKLHEVKASNGDAFHVTWNHPFWVPQQKQWVEVRDLKVDDRLLQANGTETKITSIREYPVDITKVYNFEVAKNHTYLAGNHGIVVHNYKIGFFDSLGDPFDWMKRPLAAAAEALPFAKALSNHEEIVTAAGYRQGASGEEIEALRNGIRNPDAPASGFFTAVVMGLDMIGLGGIMAWTETYKSHFGKDQWKHSMTDREESNQAAVNRTMNNLEQLWGKAADSNLTNTEQAYVLGQMLHTITDSFAGGHVQRDTTTGEIIMIQNYSGQDHDAHAEADALPPMTQGTSAIAAAERMIELWKAGASWEQTSEYLKSNVYNIRPDKINALTGSAPGYTKKTAPPVYVPPRKPTILDTFGTSRF